MRKSDVPVVLEIESYDVSSQHKSGDTVIVNIPDPENSNDGQRSPKLEEVFTYYVDRFSMHGLGLLVGSENRFVKAFWAIIIFATLLEVSFYLRRAKVMFKRSMISNIANNASIQIVLSLVLKYLEYPTRTESSLGFSDLQFPAVTICNVNIMKKSKVADSVRNFAESIRMPHITSDSKLVENNTNRLNRANTIVLNALKIISGAEYIDLESKYYGKVDSLSWEAIAERSEAHVVRQAMKSIYSSWNISEQKAAGHQADQMIISCTFATRNCFRNFVQHTNEEFGNCYTIEDKRFITKQSGPLGGLEVKLDLETDEYIPYLSPTKGAQIVIHPPNTVPLPGDEGITIPAGNQAMIGLKEVKVNRLGEPYSPCIQPDEYKKLYNVTYTRKLCQKICYIKRVADQCHCQDNQYSHINEVIKLKMNRSCSVKSEEDVDCVLRIKKTFKADVAGCNCLNPCSEVTFDVQIGYRVGHDQLILDTMVGISCVNEPEKCNSLKQNNTAELRENYIVLNIFYQDLNYEQQEEQQNYDIIQLLSDFGGIMGLFIGLSFVSLLEFTHMILGLSCYLFCKAKQRI